jgi:hypothetical protein
MIRWIQTNCQSCRRSFNIIWDEVEVQVSEENMMRKIESVTMKFKSIIDAWKRAIRAFSVELARAVQYSARVLRIMILLHSAKDFPSVLRLYGIDNSSKNE